MREFEELYKLYYKRLYAFCYKLSRNPFVAEDITQESFYQAFISLHRYNGGCEIFTWLASIAKNTYFKYLRKNKVSVQSIFELAEGDYKTEEGDTEKKALDSINAKKLRTAVKKLPEKYRDTVILRIYADLPFSQIALLLNISESSAKVLFFRAKNKLKEALYNDIM